MNILFVGKNGVIMLGHRLLSAMNARRLKLIGPSRMGMLDYFRGSAKSDPWGRSI
jgi:hypothetical protein